MARLECRTCSAARLYASLGGAIDLPPGCPAAGRCQWRHGSELSRWNGARREEGTRGPVGSQNFAELAAPAAGDYRFHAELAQLEQQEGLGSREFGSRLYWPGNLVGRMVSLKLAREADDTAAAQVIRKSLRAYWTVLSLMAQPIPVRELKLHYFDEPEPIRLRGNNHYYEGPDVALAGERFNLGCLVDGPAGMLLACALNWPERRYSRPYRSPLETGLLWPLTLLKKLVGNPFKKRGPARAFGLTPPERNTLRLVVLGERDSADIALSWLKDWPLWSSYDVEIRRTTTGTETLFATSANGNKPAVAYASLASDGFARVLMPARFTGRGANRGFKLEATPYTVRASAAHGVVHQVRRLEGKVIWETQSKGGSLSPVVAVPGKS